MRTNRRNTILVVDDEKGVCRSFGMVFKKRYHLLTAGSGKEAIDLFNKKSVDLILLDILLPDTNGLELLKQFKDADPTVEVVMVTAVKEIKTAVKAIKLGAYDYIIKPFDVDHVLNRAKRAMEKRSLVKEVSYLRIELDRLHLFEKMVGKDKKMKKVFELIPLEPGKTFHTYMHLLEPCKSHYQWLPKAMVLCSYKERAERAKNLLHEPFITAV